jgi:hypothetical protein
MLFPNRGDEICQAIHLMLDRPVDIGFIDLNSTQTDEFNHIGNFGVGRGT